MFTPVSTIPEVKISRGGSEVTRLKVLERLVAEALSLQPWCGILHFKPRWKMLLHL